MLVGDDFSLACDLPLIDFDLGDFPYIEIDFCVGKQFFGGADLVTVVDKISGLIGVGGQQVIWLLGFDDCFALGLFLFCLVFQTA